MPKADFFTRNLDFLDKIFQFLNANELNKQNF